MDMHSGGKCKEEPFEHIYIEAPQEEAELIFFNRYGHNPNRVSCTCCGEDYNISEDMGTQYLIVDTSRMAAVCRSLPYQLNF